LFQGITEGIKMSLQKSFDSSGRLLFFKDFSLKTVQHRIGLFPLNSLKLGSDVEQIQG
jgi:hypothetical protein